MTADAQIAAICPAHDATCATRNVKGFAHTGVALANPWNSADLRNPPMPLIDPPAHSALTYVPRMPELALVTELALVQDHRGLWLDVSPFGDPELVPVEDVTVSGDGGVLEFRAAEEAYEVRSDARWDRILFAAMADLAARGRPLRRRSGDRIEMLFDQGRPESLRVGRYEDGDPDEYFTVVFREDGMFFVRAAPRERVLLRRLVLDRGALIGYAQDRELRYDVDADPYVLALFARLLDSALGPDGSLSPVPPAARRPGRADRPRGDGR